MKIKTIPLIMSLLLTSTLLTGCQSSELNEYTPEDSASPTESAGPVSGEAERPDFSPAFASYDPDTVMLTINGIDVTWRELFYWYHYEVSMITAYTGALPVWDDPCMMDSAKTNREYVTEASLDTVKHYCALESKAADSGVTLTDEDRQAIDDSWKASVDSYGNGDESKFVEYLESLFLSKEMFLHINEINYIYPRMQEELYGQKGEKLEEAEILAKAEELEYLRAKHILISTKAEDGSDLSDEDKQAKKAEAEAILAELQGITDQTELEARMDELIPEKSADANAYVDGYTFLSGEMVESFENTTRALEPYKLDIAESNYGYHIILRLPLNAQAIMGFSNDGSSYTLAQVIADTLFNDATTDWAEESEIVFSKEYEKMDIAEVFGKTIYTGSQG